MNKAVREQRRRWLPSTGRAQVLRFALLFFHPVGRAHPQRTFRGWDCPVIGITIQLS
jgi:hypothetical protein